MAKQAAAYKITPNLQKIFVGSVVITFLSQAIFTIYSSISLAPHNLSFSSYAWMYLQSFIVPGAFFGFAYLFNRHKPLNLNNLFEYLLLTVSAMFVLATTELIGQQILVHVSHSLTNPNAWTSWQNVEIITIGITSVVYIFCLASMKRAKR